MKSPRQSKTASAGRAVSRHDALRRRQGRFRHGRYGKRGDHPQGRDHQRRSDPLHRESRAPRRQRQVERAARGKNILCILHRRRRGANGSPVNFFYNGGPGSSLVFLLLGSFAPRRIRTNMPHFTPPAPYTLEDNPDSLLDCSDLVFINPVGTGIRPRSLPTRTATFGGSTRTRARSSSSSSGT